MSHPPVSIWRCNNRIIQEPNSSEIVTRHLKDFFHHDTTSVEDPYMLWNALKAYIRGILIQQGAQAIKQYHLKLNTLLSQIHRIGIQEQTKHHT